MPDNVTMINYWYHYQSLRLQLLEISYGDRVWTNRYHAFRQACLDADAGIITAAQLEALAQDMRRRLDD